jgi:hypothetical protein
VQLLGQGDQINGLLVLSERDHLREYMPVLGQEEIFDAEILNSGVQRVVVQQNRAENGAFRIQIIR